MLKAGSLYYALIILILIGILVSAIILNFKTHKVLRINAEVTRGMIYNCENAIQYGLDNYENLDFNTKYETNFFNNVGETYILKKEWGAFKQLFSYSILKRDTIKKIVSVGSVNHKNNFALILSDKDKPLLFSGSAQIIGDCKLPKLGVKRAFVNESVREKKTLSTKSIKGEISNSNKELPFIDLNSEYTYSNLQKKEIDMSILDSNIYNSFYNEELVLDVTGYNIIENFSIRGKVVIKSKDSILVKKTSNLENAIICAPKVSFETGFIGSVQVFANNEIMINENVKLNYPSMLYLKPESDNKGITILSQSIVMGSVLLNNENRNYLDDRIKVDENALIVGSVYCTGVIQHMGKVIGSVLTNGFYLNTEESEYENTIHTGKIDVKNLSQDFIHIDLLKEDDKKYKAINTLW